MLDFVVYCEENLLLQAGKLTLWSGMAASVPADDKTWTRRFGAKLPGSNSTNRLDHMLWQAAKAIWEEKILFYAYAVYTAAPI